MKKLAILIGLCIPIAANADPQFTDLQEDSVMKQFFDFIQNAEFMCMKHLGLTEEDSDRFISQIVLRLVIFIRQSHVALLLSLSVQQGKAWTGRRQGLSKMQLGMRRKSRATFWGRTKEKNNLQVNLILTEITICNFYFFFLNSFIHCNKFPVNQYGITNVARKIISQNPIVKIVKKARKPKYWSNSIIIFFYKCTYRIFV